MDKKEVMQQLKLMGFYIKDADNSLEERAKKKLSEGGRIQVIAPNGDRCSVIRAGENMVQSWSEKRHQWESFPLSKCKILSVDAEPRTQYVELKTQEGGKEGQEKARKKEEELKRQHKEVKLVMASPFMTYFKWEVKDAEPTLDGYKFEDPKEIEKAIKEVEKSGHPNMQYLMALKRALELAKQERSTKDDDATEHGSIEELGKNKKTESMPLEKDPTLAQDEYKPNPKVIKILEDLRAHKLTPSEADKMLVQAGVPYVMAGLMVRKPEQYIPVNDEDKFATVMKEFYAGKLKSSSGEKVTDPQQAKAIAYSETKDSGFKKYRDQNNNVWELVNPQGSFWMMECIKGSRKGDTVTFKREAVESRMEQVRDCGPVFTKGTKDGSEDELKLRIQQLEHERNVDESISGYKSDTRKDKLIKQLKEELKKMQEKRRTQDSSYNPTFRFLGNVGRKELKQRLDWFKDRKRELEKAISEQKPHSNPEHYYFKAETKEAQRELAEVEESIKNIQNALQKITKDECMEILRLSGFATDAYDPKKYEGTHRHETNIWYLENEVVKWRGRYENAKDRVNSYRRMVSSGQYGKATTEDLKKAERDLEAARMKLEQSLSMLKKAKG